MIKSTSFWLAAICLAIIPMLCIDIAQHVVDWKLEVRGELITVVQNVYAFSRQEKAAILDRVFERNQVLTFLIYSKSIACVILPVLSFYLMRNYRRQTTGGFLKPAFSVMLLLTAFELMKIFVVNAIGSNQDIKFLNIDARAVSLQTLYNKNFSGKVLYIDFWGTTCGPCLQEFRDFTAPLKDKYRLRNDIAYLYVAQGNQYLWCEQIKKYKVDGSHIFVHENQYEQLFRHAIKDSAGVVLMPRYLIINKKGEIVETNANPPSNKNVLYAQLDKYLSEH